jgi:hypothetical protein
LSRLTELEATIAQLKAAAITKPVTITTPPKKRPSEDALQGDSTKKAVRSTVKGSAIARGDSPICPHCQSAQTDWYGWGKVRRDSTQGHKLMCNSCGKTTMIG